MTLSKTADSFRQARTVLSAGSSRSIAGGFASESLPSSLGLTKPTFFSHTAPATTPEHAAAGLPKTPIRRRKPSAKRSLKLCAASTCVDAPAALRVHRNTSDRPFGLPEGA